LTTKELLSPGKYELVRDSIKTKNCRSIYFQIDDSHPYSKKYLLKILAELATQTIKPVPIFDQMINGWTELEHPTYNRGRLFQDLEPLIGCAQEPNNNIRLIFDLNSYAIAEPYLLAMSDDLDISINLTDFPKVNFASFPITSSFQLIIRIIGPESRFYPKIASFINCPVDEAQTLNTLQPSKRAQLLASLIKTKVVLKNFWPLLDTCQAPLELIEEFKDSILQGEELDPLNTFKKITFSMKDGHSVAYTDYSNEDLWIPPLWAQWVGENLVINFIDSSISSNTGISPNDNISLIDGKSPTDIFKQLKNNRNYSRDEGLRAESAAMGLMFAGAKDTLVELTIEGRSHKLLRSESIYSFNPICCRPKVHWFDHSIVYINSETIEEPSDVRDILNNPSLRGLILDLRGYPRLWILQSFFEKYGIGTAPSLYYKNPMVRGLAFDYVGTNSNRRNPVIVEKQLSNRPVICAIIDGCTFSRGEEFAWAIRESLGGKLFGEQTSGCDGDMTEMHLLEGIKFRFTGMSVMMPNGIDINRNGVVPDQLIQSYYQGKDLLSDRIINHALDYIRTTILE
jgi:hypothetical protein